MPSLKVLLLFSRVILRCSDKYSKAYLEKSKCLLKKAFKRNLKNEVFFFFCLIFVALLLTRGRRSTPFFTGIRHYQNDSE